MAELKRLQLIKVHEEREAKNAALNAKLLRGLDSKQNAEKMMEFAKNLKVKKRPQTAGCLYDF